MTESLLDWKYRQVTKNMLKFYKQSKIIHGDIQAVQTTNPETNEDDNGLLTLAIACELSYLTLRIDDLARRLGAMTESDWVIMENSLQRQYQFSMKITQRERIIYSLENNPLGQIIYKAAYFLLR